MCFDRHIHGHLGVLLSYCVVYELSTHTIDICIYIYISISLGLQVCN